MKKIIKKQYNQKLEKQIREILDSFDFDRVCEFMHWGKAVREYGDDYEIVDKRPWKIITPNRGFVIPTVRELKEDAEKLLRDLVKRVKKENYYSIRTGPFEVTYTYGSLELKCVIESWYAE